MIDAIVNGIMDGIDAIVDRINAVVYRVNPVVDKIGYGVAVGIKLLGIVFVL